MAPLELAYEAVGDGPPLVVLHGLFGSAGNWRAVAKRLGARRRVWCLDLRNHGASPWADDVSYAALAGDLEAFLARHGIAGAAVLGHSMGGKAAMALALQHPEAVAALIVVDVAPVAYGLDLQAYVHAMAGVELAQAERRGEADALLAEEIADAGVRAFLLQNLVTRDGRLAWRLNLAALDRGMETIAGWPEALSARRYDGPTHFIAGGASRYIRPAHRDAILALFPAATYTVIPGAGHRVHAEKPDAFVRAVERFLEAAGA